MATYTVKKVNNSWESATITHVESGREFDLIAKKNGYEFYRGTTKTRNTFFLVCETGKLEDGEEFLNGISARDKYERLVKNAR